MVNEGAPALPGIVEAVKEWECSLHDTPVSAKPKLMPTKSGKTRPGGKTKIACLCKRRWLRIFRRIGVRVRSVRWGRIQPLIARESLRTTRLSMCLS